MYGFRSLLWSGIKLGARWHPIALALGYHSHQCDQRWWGIRVGRFRLAYRTRGDATPDIHTYRDGGWWWPWQTERTCAGSWL